jgi:hypothetical protein
MKNNTLPTFDALMNPLLGALRALGGSGSIEEVYAKTDWSRFESIPLFRVANRMNAYNTYLLMEQQGEP